VLLPIVIGLLVVVTLVPLIFSLQPGVQTLMILGQLALSAFLGNLIQLDLSKDLARNMARPAARGLLDHSTRLRNLVTLAEAREGQLRQASIDGIPVDHDQVADWFAEMNRALREEITAAASAIENWRDLATDVIDDEQRAYLERRNAEPPPTPPEPQPRAGTIEIRAQRPTPQDRGELTGSNSRNDDANDHKGDDGQDK